MNVLLNTLSVIIIMIAVLIFEAVYYSTTTFYGLTFQEIVFNLTNKLKSANMDVLWKAAKKISFPTIILLILFYILPHYININYLLYAFILLLISIIYAYFALGVNSYLVNYSHNSKFIEHNYMDPKKVDIIFPKKKRNLIYIYLESMESTYNNIDNNNLIPNLTKLANNNINFSQNNKIGGAKQIDSVGWTSAAITASTTGVPLKINAFSKNDYALKDMIALSDILYQHGYNQEFMVGSDSEFGARKKYLKAHHYQIVDYNSLLKDKRLPKNYKVWWGVEDSKLISFAQEDLLNLSKKGKPFNFTILTSNTHFIDGYLEKGSLTPFNNHYSNAIYNSDVQIYNFIEWIKRQDFYKDTTIVISGDHLTMQNDLFKHKKYDRSVYNAIVNSPIEPIKEKNREFATIDMFPTTLASLNVIIKGNHLGLGTNLFSDEKTIIEQHTYDYVNNELKKKSVFYSNKILKR